jgi:hypothetical protein
MLEDHRVQLIIVATGIGSDDHAVKHIGERGFAVGESALDLLREDSFQMVALAFEVAHSSASGTALPISRQSSRVFARIGSRN